MPRRALEDRLMALVGKEGVTFSGSAVNLDDGFDFAMGAPTLDLDAAPYGGARFPVEAPMAARRFAKFHRDVSSGDVLREPYEVLAGRDWFGFAGLSRARVPAVSWEEPFAEKLHAYPLRVTDGPIRAGKIWWPWRF